MEPSWLTRGIIANHWNDVNISTVMVHEIRMVTADKKLVALLAGTDLKQHVSWLGNF
jgi:hypothetical protein